MKVAQPITRLVAMMGWPAALPEWAVRSIGAVELFGAVGLLLPLAAGSKPDLPKYAALGFVALQLCAISFHVSRGEFFMLPINLVLLALAAVVVMGYRRVD